MSNPVDMEVALARNFACQLNTVLDRLAADHAVRLCPV